MLPRLTLLAAFLMTCLAVSTNDASAAELVKYRAEQWQAKHIHDDKKAKTISSTLTKLGCEVKQDQHNGHIDVKYRCPKWKDLELKSHEEAHKWEKWLKEYGFETQHTH